MERANNQGIPGAKPRIGGTKINLDWVYKSLDAVMTAPLNPKEQRKDLFKSVIRRRSSNYKRVSSFFNLLDSIRPGLAKGSANLLCRVRYFPIPGYEMSLLGFGTGATVFLLERDTERKVLKVFRRSLGKPAEEALKITCEYRDKYLKTSSWFNDPYDIVIPSRYLMLHGPLLGVTAGAVIQPYIEGKKLDLFQDFTDDEVVQLGSADENFRLQLLDFSRRLFASFREDGVCFDLVGRENLMVVEDAQGYWLKIADNGVFDVPYIREQSPAVYARLKEDLERLQDITKRLTK